MNKYRFDLDETTLFIIVERKIQKTSFKKKLN